MAHATTGSSSHLAPDPALAAYYADRKLMWRNVRWIMVGNFGTATCMSILGPLMNLRLKAVGLSESGIGLIAAANMWAVSFLVMYFSWKSDHLVTRWGRRIPYLFLSLPFIITTIVLFPLFDNKWILVGLMLVNLYFSDMKASTYPLLKIDCVPREVLARMAALSTITISLGSFLALRYGARLADYSEYLPYLIGGAVMAIASLLAAFRIKEPPIRNPTTERFTPFSTMKVAWRDRRTVVLMLAIAMLGSFACFYNAWLWFYAKQTLNLTRAETGAALSWGVLITVGASYPAGWLIDRFGSYVVLVIYWCLMLVMFLMLGQVSSATGLIAVAMLFAVVGPLSGAGEMILLKQIHPAEVGSVTSTNSFLRNFYHGSIIFLSGYLVEWTGRHYPTVFAVGFALSTVSVMIFFFYRRLLNGSATATDLTP